MSKFHPRKFDYSSLNIHREISEEIGKSKNNRIYNTYINLPKIPKNKSKENFHINNQIYPSNSKNKKSEEKGIISVKNSTKSLVMNNEQKMQKNMHFKTSSHTSLNNSISRDKERTKKMNNKEQIKIIKAKVVKKRNYDHIERVVIDLVSKVEIDNSIKNDSKISRNIYENDYGINKKKYKNKNPSYNYDKNKDNNICHNGINDISIAINMIESRWRNNFSRQKEIEMPFICDEINRKKKEIEIILNRWKENQIIINEDKLSILNENNIIKKWKNNEKIVKEIELNFSIDDLISKEKQIRNIIEKWKKCIQKIKGDNFSFFIDILKSKENELKNIIKRWNNYNQKIKGENISFLYEKNKNIKSNWNNNDIQKENKISISFQVKKEKDIFKYSDKKYINDLMQKINLSENNTNNFYIINQENDENDLKQINYKIVKPKNKEELELEINNYYIEKKNNNYNIESKINPIFVLNDEQIKLLNEECYKSSTSPLTRSKKECAESGLTIEKQKGLEFEIIDPYIFSENNKNVSSNLNKENSSNEKSDKINENKCKNDSEDFGQYTPLTMLQEKFYLYAVSRNSKYSIQSPQLCISFLGNYNKNENINGFSFNINRLNVNHFSLWIERIESNKNSERIEINENK